MVQNHLNVTSSLLGVRSSIFQKEMGLDVGALAGKNVIQVVERGAGVYGISFVFVGCVDAGYLAGVFGNVVDEGERV
jgi:hypothetical protein